jgi:hypothetical protein
MPYGKDGGFKMKGTSLYKMKAHKNSAMPMKHGSAMNMDHAMKMKHSSPMDMDHAMKMYGKPMKMAYGNKPMKKNGSMEKESEKITKNQIKKLKKAVKR